MCGIAGIYDHGRSPEPARVSRMLALLEHRGPDGSGTFVADDVVLGHRRLAIIDTSEGGAQPMHCSRDRYVITYNGEIYNYVELRSELEGLGASFRSRSDTEVLLAAYAEWGTDCLDRLNGMFAFAIYDRIDGTLFCARDRLGVKPFSYTWDGRRFGFASEVKALLAGGLASGDCRPDAVYEYLARGYTTGGRSFYDGVEVLEPGHALLVSPRGLLRTWCWWRPSTEPDMSLDTREQWGERVAAVLDDSVRLRLRSDVPVGAHLSGGMDSSAVVAAAARHGGTAVETFTGAFRDDSHSDEREFSRVVARMYGLAAHEVEIGVDELPAQFERILWHMDEPIAGPGVFPQLLVCDLAAAHGFKVVLGGQGGDELFGGYLRHRALYYKQKALSGCPFSAFELLRMAAGELRRVRGTSTRVSDADLAPSFVASVDPEFRQEVRRSRLSFANASELMLWDLRNYLPALLHVEDRTSMAASIESRTPLLDYRLVELALTIPERLRFKRGEPKPVLRAGVGKWLPTSVAARRDKRGFPTPLHYWKERDSLRELVHDLTTPKLGGPRESDRPGAWSVSGEREDGRTVFADDYLSRRDDFQPSELWTVLTVNGWLSGLQAGAFSRPGASRAA